MRYLFITILWLLLGLWMLAGTYYWLCRVRGQCEVVREVLPAEIVEPVDSIWAQLPLPEAIAPPAVAEQRMVARGLNGRGATVKTPFLIRYGDQVWLEDSSNLRFRHSDPIGDLPASTAMLLDSLVHYCRAHPRTTVLLRGHYAPEEENRSDFSNLGIARANFLASELLARGFPGARLNVEAERTPAAELFDTQGRMWGGVEVFLIDLPEAAPPAEEIVPTGIYM